MHVGLLAVYVEHLHQSGNQLLLVHAAEPPLLSSSRESCLLFNAACFLTCFSHIKIPCLSVSLFNIAII